MDKYRPRQLGELTYHHNVTEVLSQLATRDDFPHMLFYGPLGAGKKTRVYCFLEAIFGNGVYKLKSEEKVIKLENTSTSVECFVISSNYHLEICPADSENNDRHVVQRVIKEAASNQNIDAKSVKQHSFKVIIINDADRLTKEAQAALRRTMEKYMSACRIIMICENRNKIIAPIRSRCLNIRIGAPNTDSIVEALELIDNKESLSYSAQVLTSLASNCNGNLRSAILGLQMWKNNKGHTTNKTDSLKPLWMAEIGTIVKSIIEEQSPNKLKTLRDQFYELLFAALWSDNPNTAYAATCLFPESRLDIANIDRWLQVVKPHVFDEHAHYEWDTLKHLVSTADVTWLLTDPPRWHSEVRAYFLSNLHRSMRPEHIPQLAKLTQHQDPFVRKGALTQLGWLTVYTNQHR